MVTYSQSLLLNKHKQHQNNQELNNDNQNNRQFRCKCLKKYKSYPALYTHIKNKHPRNIQQFKSQCKKPKQGDIQKGRPKKHKNRPQEAQEQGQLLNIIDMGVLQIDQILKQSKRNKNYKQVNRQQKTQDNKQDNMNIHNNNDNNNNNDIKYKHQQQFWHSYQILQGNNTIKQQDLLYQYKQMKQFIIAQLQCNPNNRNNKLFNLFIEKIKLLRFQSLSEEISVKVYTQEIRFKNQLIQHFNSEIACKILLQLGIIQMEKQIKINQISSLSKENKIQENKNKSKNKNNSINSENIYYDQRQSHELSHDQYSDQLTNIINLVQQKIWGNEKGKITASIRDIYNKWMQKIKQLSKSQQN